MKTPEEIAELKASWAEDPSWDIEDTEGFEAHRDELKAWREARVSAAKAEADREHEAVIAALVKPALDILPEHADDGFCRSVAATQGSTTNILLRMVAEMLLPVVKRLERVDDHVSDLDEETDQRFADHQSELDELRGHVGAA